MPKNTFPKVQIIFWLIDPPFSQGSPTIEDFLLHYWEGEDGCLSLKPPSQNHTSASFVNYSMNSVWTSAYTPVDESAWPSLSSLHKLSQSACEVCLKNIGDKSFSFPEDIMVQPGLVLSAWYVVALSSTQNRVWNLSLGAPNLPKPWRILGRIPAIPIFRSFSHPLPEMVLEGSSASWVKWLILNVMLASSFIEETRIKLK